VKITFLSYVFLFIAYITAYTIAYTKQKNNNISKIYHLLNVYGENY